MLAAVVAMAVMVAAATAVAAAGVAGGTTETIAIRRRRSQPGAGENIPGASRDTDPCCVSRPAPLSFQNTEREMESLINLIPGEALRVGALALAMFASGAGLVTLPQELRQSDDAAGCAVIAPETGAEPWIRTELFFGMSRPDGGKISGSEWERFLDTEITPRFPEGLTVLSGSGQWQDENQQIVEEPSKLLILLYPREAIPESHKDIEEIRAAYEQRFQQDSVLRADDDRPVCTSF